MYVLAVPKPSRLPKPQGRFLNADCGSPSCPYSDSVGVKWGLIAEISTLGENPQQMIRDSGLIGVECGLGTGLFESSSVMLMHAQFHKSIIQNRQKIEVIQMSTHR